MHEHLPNSPALLFDDQQGDENLGETRQMHDYMRYLICYDTPDNRRRRRMVDVLSETCERVQWSVFEGWMTERQLVTLAERLRRVVDPHGDNVRIYRLCAYCQEEVKLLGLGETPRLARYWIV